MEPCLIGWVKGHQQSRKHIGTGRSVGFTLIELLCVMAIILILASLLLGPASRILGRVLADQWSEQASLLLSETVTELNQHFQGRDNFPLVTLEGLEAQGWLKPRHLQFLKDRRVIFVPFAGSDPDDKIVIVVRLKHGFWTEANELTENKEAITHVPR